MRITDHIPPRMRIVVGVVLSTIAAFATARVFVNRPTRVFIPFAFIVVLIVLARTYGVLTSVIGSAITAVIFARFMYPPLGTLGVDSEVAKANLGWMMLCAITISYLLFPPTKTNH